MNNWSTTKTGYFIIASALFITLLIDIMLASVNIRLDYGFLFFVGFLGAYIFFFCWTSIPYVLMWYSLKNNIGSTRRLIIDCIAIFFSSGIGLYLYVDILYIHPDAQGGIALVAVPVVQVAVYGALSMVLNIVNIVEWFFRKD